MRARASTGWSAVTVTVKEAVPVLPAASVAEQVTVVVPRANVVPDAGEHVAVSGAVTASDAVAVKLTATGAVDCTVMFAGTVTVGAVVSCTVTVKEALALFPATSFAVQLTVVAPNPKVEPDAGVQTSVTTPGRSSVAVTV